MFSLFGSVGCFSDAAIDEINLLGDHDIYREINKRFLLIARECTYADYKK